ncbi:MAG: phosphoribosyltransferase [Candidatus Thorarchaeota archaeon]
MRLKLYQNRQHVGAAILSMALKIRQLSCSDEETSTCNFNPDSKLCFISILKGGVYVAHKIFSNLHFDEKSDVVFGYLGISSYKQGVVSSKHPMITYPLDLDKSLVQEKDIWIIDDVVDTGSTLLTAIDILECYHPNSIRVAVLVDKIHCREENNLVKKPDVVGFTYEGDEFLVGVGLGYGELYRGLDCLYELEE